MPSLMLQPIWISLHSLSSAVVAVAVVAVAVAVAVLAIVAVAAAVGFYITP